MPDVLNCNGMDGTVFHRKTFCSLIFSKHLFLDIKCAVCLVSRGTFTC